MDLNESLEQLEEKLSRAAAVFKRALGEKRELEQALRKIKEDSGGSEKRIEALQREVQLLRREREEVRVRVEKLMAQIDQLTNSHAAEK